MAKRQEDFEVDTTIRHTTKAGTNIFEDLGFSKDEASIHYEAVRKEIDKLASVKHQLMGEISSWIEDNGLKQGDAANILHVSRPRVSDIVNNKANKFTIDSLVTMLSRAGKDVKVMVGSFID